MSKTAYLAEPDVTKPALVKIWNLVSQDGPRETSATVLSENLYCCASCLLGR